MLGYILRARVLQQRSDSGQQYRIRRYLKSVNLSAQTAQMKKNQMALALAVGTAEAVGDTRARYKMALELALPRRLETMRLS